MASVCYEVLFYLGPQFTTFRQILSLGGAEPGLWFQSQWDTQWKPHHIMVKELLSNILSAAVWGPQLKRQRMLFKHDNASVWSHLYKRAHPKIQLACTCSVACGSSKHTMTWSANTYLGLLITPLTIYQGTICKPSIQSNLRHPTY